MKTLRHILAVAALAVVGSLATAQTQLFRNNQTTEVNASFSIGANPGRNVITWKTGSTGVFSVGSVLTVNGTFNANPTGGTWNLANVTITGGLSGDAVTTGTLDQFANVTQTAGKTMAITGNVTLGDGSLSGSNTGDQNIVLSGDVSGSGTGSITTVLANSGVTAGTYGNATRAVQVTVDGKGRITSITNVTITGGSGNIINGVTFGNNSLVYVSNNTTGEISAIPGATYNSGNNTITFNGTIAATTLNVSSLTGQLAGANGGTGVDNTGKTITLGGNLTTSGANNIIFTTSGATNAALPAGTSTLAAVGGNIGAATATTPAEDDNSTKVATTAYVQTEIASLGGGGAYETGDVKFILDSASVPSGWALTGANGIAAFTTPDADYKAVMKMAGIVATPTFSPVAGAVPAGHTITLSSATSGVTFMTTNNTTDPSRSVGTAGGTWTINGNQTIESMGYKDGAYLIDSAVASAAYTIDPLPELTAAEIDGTTLTLTYSEAVSRGAGYSNAHFDLDMSTTGSNIGVTYVGGDGTTEHVYTAASAAVSGETVDLDFSGTANSIEETGGYNQDLAAITSAAVTNSTPGGGGTNFLTGYTLGLARTDGGNYYTGFRFTVGASSLTVSELGRYSTTGSSGTHSIYIAALDGTPVVSGSINATSGANDWVFTSVTPTVLTPGATYWLLCQEVTGGDTFYGDNTTITTTGAASVTHSAYVATYGAGPTTNGLANFSYGPVTFKYTAASGSWAYAAETGFDGVDSNLNPSTMVWSDITLGTGNATQIGIHVTTVNFAGAIRVALYNNSGTRVAEALSSTISTTGWHNIPIPVTAVTSGTYRIGYIGQDNDALDISFNNGSGTSNYSASLSLGASPSTLPASDGSFTGRPGARVWVE